MTVLRFLDPFGGLGAMYDDHLTLRHIGKRVGDFLLVLRGLFC